MRFIGYPWYEYLYLVQILIYHRPDCRWFKYSNFSHAKLCASHIFRYRPPLFASSSECVPCSTTLPPKNTQIVSASLIVDNRCATAIVIRSPSFAASERACCTIFSLSVSKALTVVCVDFERVLVRWLCADAGHRTIAYHLVRPRC